METADVERQIVLHGYILESGYVSNPQIGLYVFLPGFLFCNANRFWREIHTCNLPASMRECDDIRASATTKVNGSAGWMGSDKFEKFGGRDSAIPGRFAKIPKVEDQAAKHIVGFVVELSLKNCDACHFDNSYEFFYNHATC